MLLALWECDVELHPPCMHPHQFPIPLVVNTDATMVQYWCKSNNAQVITPFPFPLLDLGLGCHPLSNLLQATRLGLTTWTQGVRAKLTTLPPQGGSHGPSNATVACCRPTMSDAEPMVFSQVGFGVWVLLLYHTSLQHLCTCTSAKSTKTTKSTSPLTIGSI